MEIKDMSIDPLTSPKRPVHAGYFTCFMGIDELLQYFEACRTGEIYIPLCND